MKERRLYTYEDRIQDRFQEGLLSTTANTPVDNTVKNITLAALMAGASIPLIGGAASKSHDPLLYDKQAAAYISYVGDQAKEEINDAGVYVQKELRDAKPVINAIEDSFKTVFSFDDAAGKFLADEIRKNHDMRKPDEVTTESYEYTPSLDKSKKKIVPDHHQQEFELPMATSYAAKWKSPAAQHIESPKSVTRVVPKAWANRVAKNKSHHAAIAPSVYEGSKEVFTGPGAHNFSDRAVEVIKDLEGFKPKPFLDNDGRYRIGYGTIANKNDSPISQEEATERLKTELDGKVKDIHKYVKIPLKQNQMDALTVMAFNTGAGPLTGEMGEKLNSGNIFAAAKSLLQWCHDKENGVEVVSRGLFNRRLQEAHLLLEGMPEAELLPPPMQKKGRG